jgi:hydrogenase-4 component B
MSLLIILMAGGYGLGVVGAVIARSARGVRTLTAVGAVLGSAAGLVLGIGCLFGNVQGECGTTALLSAAGGLALRLDPLSGFFLAVIGIVAIPSTVYGVSYSKAYEGRHSLRLLGAMLNLFLLSMALVTLANNVITFLMLWEAMSLASYFLVMTEVDQPETVRAGGWYLAMTHAGFVLLVVAFFLMSGSAGSSFADLRTNAATLSQGVRNAVFALALLGFGSKAGIVPLHVWLPRAHPAAPSHVSALMSGVMIKMGIYGLLRVGFDLLGGGPAWWGGLVLVLGAASALLGVLYALVEHDLKRLLAYHSVENIGIILLGVGAALMFHSYGLISLAVFGLVGALYHTLNHACFKGLLFLGAGATLHATGTRNMEELGGLVKRMPQTAIFFLIGSAAIAALPPLNGFASEWIVFQALLGGARIPRPEVAVVMPVAVGMLALTSGLAAACFVKAFGITFLALPRSRAAADAQEVPRSMRVGMGGLAAACVVLGIAPVAVVPVLGRIISDFARFAPAPAPQFTLQLSVQAPEALGRMSSFLLALGLIGLIALTALMLRLLKSNARPRFADTWGCGRIGQTPRMEYTATAFAEPLRRVFAELYRPTQDLVVEQHPASRYFIQSIEYRSEIDPWFERALYEPFLSTMRAAARQVRRLQAGSVHLYLAYLTIALLTLLAFTWWLA